MKQRNSRRKNQSKSGSSKRKVSSSRKEVRSVIRKHEKAWEKLSD